MRAKLRPLIALSLLLLATAVSTRPAETALLGWQSVAPGIDYQLFELPHPNRVFVARMDRFNPDLIVDTSIARGSLVGGRETISQMAARYDQALNAWGGVWGARNRVLVAINGSFHDTGTGVPESGMIHSGWYAKRFDDHGGGSGFVWTLEREAFLGGCVEHRADAQILRYHRTGRTQWIDGVNVPRSRDRLIVYTPQYDRATRTSNAGVEVLVQLTQPAMVFPPPRMLRGYVVGIFDGRGRTPIPFDHIVLSAAGRAREALLAGVGIGDEIGISMEISHFAADCWTPHGSDWTKAYASLAGSFPFLQNRTIVHFNHDRGAVARHPRTAVCFNRAYMYFVVVDGRREGVSIGMTIDELAGFCRSTLGATWGINQDGGGSSTMWINGQVVNAPSEHGKERPIANGLMMIAVEPPIRSIRFRSGEEVAAVEQLDVRLGPGTNYGILETLPAGAQGRVTAHRNGLDGIFAKGETWWLVDWGTSLGWVAERSLLSLNPLPPAERFEDLTE